MDKHYFQSKHEAGSHFETYINSGKPGHRDDWQRVYDQAQLTEAQRNLVASFVRRVNIIALSGTWCGDCVQQGPLIQRIAEANSKSIDLRWLDRDEHKDLQEKVRINGGDRVPVLIFCAEDYEPVGWYGDRTLARYRAIAARQLGASCALPGAPVDAQEMAATIQDWLDEIERVHLLLRLSGRLRQLHGD